VAYQEITPSMTVTTVTNAAMHYSKVNFNRVIIIKQATISCQRRT